LVIVFAYFVAGTVIHPSHSVHASSSPCGPREAQTLLLCKCATAFGALLIIESCLLLLIHAELGTSWRSKALVRMHSCLQNHPLYQSTHMITQFSAALEHHRLMDLNAAQSFAT
jgi:hypothetical protein